MKPPNFSNLVAPMRGKTYWDVPVVTMQASTNKNIDELHRQVCAHYETLKSASLLEERRQRQRRDHFTQMLKERLVSGIDVILRQDASLTSLIDDVGTGKLDTYSAVEKVFKSDALFARLKVSVRDSDNKAK